MKCNNYIIVLYWKTGKRQILGSYEQAKSCLDKNMNGKVSEEICDGDIECTISCESSYDDGCGSYPELKLFLQCNKCEKSFPVDAEYEMIEKIHKLVNQNLEKIWTHY